jgi:hypothetical protein
MKHVKKNVKYAVRKADTHLDITIGSGQIGSSTVLKDDRELGSGGSMLSLNLGPGADLKGTDVVVASLVQDVLTQTNRVTVEYVLSGGVKKESFVAKTVVDQDLDLCRFTTTISFVEPS